MEDTDSSSAPEPGERPWIVLNNTYDVEAWIDSYNRDLQRSVENRYATGYGICFRLAEGGEIYLQTDQEGDVLLDVTPEAEWVAPLITAATRIEAPASRIWALPGHTLTQLVLGLSSLIATTRIVTRHPFKTRKF
jgi:hypothetical protein